MRAEVRTAGLSVAVDCASSGTADLLQESFAGDATSRGPDQLALDHVDLHVVVERARCPFPVEGWEPLTRGAWRSSDAVVVTDACSSGFDLHLRVTRTPTATRGRLEVRARQRVGVRDRAQAGLLPGRHHLLVRSALVHYPALWWAGVHGRVPLHASVLTVGPEVVLLAGPGGTGKSTLLRAALADGERATCDNLAVSDGGPLYGLLEPIRTQGGTGRRMPYGRRESPWSGRAEQLSADRAVVVRRGGEDVPTFRPVPAWEVVRALCAGTYAAGELRRYWPFAATLALGTGLGPAHPPVLDIARRLVSRLECSELVLPARPGTTLRELLASRSVAS